MKTFALLLRGDFAKQCSATQNTFSKTCHMVLGARNMNLCCCSENDPVCGIEFKILLSILTQTNLAIRIPMLQVILLDKTRASLYNPSLTAPEKKEMAIKIKDIPPEGLTLELDRRLDIFGQGEETAFKAVLIIKPTGSGNFHITGRIQSEPQLECNLCLKPFSFKIDTELSVDVAPLNSMGTSPEHELTGGELDTDFYEGDEIEPIDFVKEQLLISVPMVPVHSPDCKGLCPVCGTDRNEAECGCRKEGDEGFGPFSKLKDLFKK